MDEPGTGAMCKVCGLPILGVAHTKSFTCRGCQVRIAKAKMRLPPWSVIEVNIELVVQAAKLRGDCYASLDEFPLTSPLNGHKI